MTIDVPHNARSRRTRQALLDTARSMIESDGFAGLTMTTVAEAAGVSRRGAYMHFASREDLLAALYRHLGEAESLPQSLAAVWESPDATAAVEEWARHIARAHPRILAVSMAIEEARRVDDEAARLSDLTMSNWLKGCTRLAQWLADDGVLADGWTIEEAADWMWGLMSWDLLARMTVERGWSAEQFAERYAATLLATLVRPADPASG